MNVKEFADFIKSGNKECGTYYFEDDHKIYKFLFGADGSMWETTDTFVKHGCHSSPDDIRFARNQKNYLMIAK